MKRTFSIVLACLMLVSIFAACTPAGNETSDPTSSTSSVASTSSESTPVEPTFYESVGLDNNLKFTDTRSIVVEVFDRGQEDGRTHPEDNFYSKWIHDNVLEAHNIDVTFRPVPRWTEDQEINNLLAAGNAPDICYTYSFPTINTYVAMGGVQNMADILNNDEYLPLLTDMFTLMTPDNIYARKIPDTGDIWYMETRLMHLTRTGTFVREDWLAKLNLAAPTTTAEFEAMLLAFKDNAETLLGADASKIVPFSMSYDVGWRIDHLAASFIDNDITDKEYYIKQFDDRHLLRDNYKEAVRLVNSWYNKGLMWNDFALYGAGDTTEDDMMKAGYVGSFIHNWDYPYRNGDNSIIANLQTLVGPEATYVAVEPFKNNAGVYKKFLSAPIDRKVFFPTTNTEPLASFMYLNWLATPDNYKFLQTGEEGVTKETLPDGSIKTIAGTGDKIMNSGNNIDYTMLMNGIWLPESLELTQKSLANGYAGIESRLIETAYKASLNGGRVDRVVNVGIIDAEEGMATILKEKRDAFLDSSVVATPDKFDDVYDGGMADYLASGGQAIIDERIAKWEQYFGSSTSLPQ